MIKREGIVIEIQPGVFGVISKNPVKKTERFSKYHTWRGNLHGVLGLIVETHPIAWKEGMIVEGSKETVIFGRDNVCIFYPLSTRTSEDGPKTYFPDRDEAYV